MDNSGGEAEQKMWEVMKNRSENETGRTVRIAFHGANAIGGMHKHQATDIIKSWENRGLVMTTSNGARAMLTELGANTDDPTSVDG